MKDQPSKRKEEVFAARGTLLSELGKALLKIGALRVGTFPTKRGKVSPYFIDLRNLSSYPEAFDLASRCLISCVSGVEEARRARFDSICGVPISGLIISAALAVRLGRPLVYPSAHESRIQGLLRPGQQVVVIDDVSETGESMRAACQAVANAGGIAEVALSLIDRGEEAKESLAKVGVELHSFTTTSELATTLKEMMAISEDEERAIESKPESVA